MLVARANQKARDDLRSSLTAMPWHDRKPDPWYAIRTIKGAWGTVYRVAFTRHGRNVAKLFRVRDFDSEGAALKAARAWRDGMTLSLLPETKQEFSQRMRPDNTSGCPGVYLKRQVVRRGDWSGEYAFWQAQTPQGVKPFRSRSFSVDRYGFVGAYELAVQARAEFVAEVDGYVGVTPIPERFRPAK
jgi:hypothetical protein